MMIEDITDIIEKNREKLNLKWSNIYYSVNRDEDTETEKPTLELFIETKYKKLPSKKKEEEIRKLFNARDVMFVDIPDNEDNSSFWSVRLY